MRNLGLRVIAVILILSFLTPIPGGTALLGLGLSILVCTSLRFALILQGLRRRHGRIDRALHWVESKLGPRRAAGLMNSRPDADPRNNLGLSVDKQATKPRN